MCKRDDVIRKGRAAICKGRVAICKGGVAMWKGVLILNIQIKSGSGLPELVYEHNY